MPGRPTLDHDDRTDRRLALLLAIDREANIRRKGGWVHPDRRRIWERITDPGAVTPPPWWPVRIVIEGVKR